MGSSSVGTATMPAKEQPGLLNTSESTQVKNLIDVIFVHLHLLMSVIWKPICVPILEKNHTNANYVPSAAVIEVTCPITEGASIKWYQLKVLGLP
uniref:Macaca fascicularis brain cDNA clone: QtrA-18182, similar to human zinc finger protein, subfamily 1A, 5 (ZNFN1A5), mRNA, RefSeq: NM_022466.2 n=1 Tax=Macaca fascicularis TaxID=9541 RepID=I7G9V4_MACFA|nr:unnamed protein product [Macaca fascicularis]